MIFFLLRTRLKQPHRLKLNVFSRFSFKIHAFFDWPLHNFVKEISLIALIIDGLVILKTSRKRQPKYVRICNMYVDLWIVCHTHRKQASIVKEEKIGYQFGLFVIPTGKPVSKNLYVKRNFNLFDINDLLSEIKGISLKIEDIITVIFCWWRGN